MDFIAEAAPFFIFLGLIWAVRKLWSAQPIYDEAVWHPHTHWHPVFTIERKLAMDVWRRRRFDGKWEYSLNKETDENWLNRQW